MYAVSILRTLFSNILSESSVALTAPSGLSNWIYPNLIIQKVRKITKSCWKKLGAGPGLGASQQNGDARTREKEKGGDSYPRDRPVSGSVIILT